MRPLVVYTDAMYAHRSGCVGIVIFDPERKETISVNNPCTHHMRVDYSAYEGFEVQGFTETVLSRGRVIIENNEQKIEKGGQFVKRALTGSRLD